MFWTYREGLQKRRFIERKEVKWEILACWFYIEEGVVDAGRKTGKVDNYFVVEALEEKNMINLWRVKAYDNHKIINVNLSTGIKIDIEGGALHFNVLRNELYNLDVHARSDPPFAGPRSQAFL